MAVKAAKNECESTSYSPLILHQCRSMLLIVVYLFKIFIPHLSPQEICLRVPSRCLPNVMIFVPNPVLIFHWHRDWLDLKLKKNIGQNPMMSLCQDISISINLDDKFPQTKKSTPGRCLQDIQPPAKITWLAFGFPHLD